MSLVLRLKKTRLILLADYLVLLLCLGSSGLKWMFSDPDLLQNFWLFHLRLGIWIFHLSLAWTLPLHWASRRGVQMRPSPPILQCLRPLCLLSRFLPRTIHIQGIYLARLLDQIDVVSIRSFEEIGWYSTIALNGITGPLKGFPNRLSYGDFPSNKRSCSLGNPMCFWTLRCWRTMIPGWVFTSFAKF